MAPPSHRVPRRPVQHWPLHDTAPYHDRLISVNSKAFHGAVVTHTGAVNAMSAPTPARSWICDSPGRDWPRRRTRLVSGTLVLPLPCHGGIVPGSHSPSGRGY